MKKNKGRKFSRRQNVILQLMLSKIQNKDYDLGMEEILEHLEKKGILPRKNARQSVLVTMRGLEKRLEETNIRLQNNSERGRGQWASWKI